MFRNDYSEICAPEVLRALEEHLGEQNVGYGLDAPSARAEALILDTFGLSPERSAVHFITGGTQTNALVISYFLRPWESVIACESGHINVHETGAVEAWGHKVLTCPAHDGKLAAADVSALVRRHTDEHMVKPRMVYISDSTETGTLYTAAELKALRAVCDELGLLLYLDGARLAVALTCPENDVTPELLGRVCDVFYAGGTKNGATSGEAVIIRDKASAPDFRYHIKNRGAMLAKGFVLGIEFERLFADGLWFSLARHSNETAAQLREGLVRAGIELVGGSLTNQIFLRLPCPDAEWLADEAGAELWTDEGETRVMRLVTSFATRSEDCAALCATIAKRHG